MMQREPDRFILQPKSKEVCFLCHEQPAILLCEVCREPLCEDCGYVAYDHETKQPVAIWDADCYGWWLTYDEGP